MPYITNFNPDQLSLYEQAVAVCGLGVEIRPYPMPADDRPRVYWDNGLQFSRYDPAKATGLYSLYCHNIVDITEFWNTFYNIQQLIE